MTSEARIGLFDLAMYAPYIHIIVLFCGFAVDAQEALTGRTEATNQKALKLRAVCGRTGYTMLIKMG